MLRCIQNTGPHHVTTLSWGWVEAVVEDCLEKFANLLRWQDAGSFWLDRVVRSQGMILRADDEFSRTLAKVVDHCIQEQGEAKNGTKGAQARRLGCVTRQRSTDRGRDMDRCSRIDVIRLYGT